jgi:MFS superfamily sulfate permease-like transporter
MLLARVSRPHVAFLGRIPGTQRFSDLARHADNEVVPGVVIVRVEAALVYFNAGYVSEAVRHRVHSEATPVQLVVWDLSSSPYVDVAGARMLADLEAAWASQGMQLKLAEARANVRDTLRAAGLEERVSRIDRRTSVEDIVAAFRPVS